MRLERLCPPLHARSSTRGCQSRPAARGREEGGREGEGMREGERGKEGGKERKDGWIRVGLAQLSPPSSFRVCGEREREREREGEREREIDR